MKSRPPGAPGALDPTVRYARLRERAAALGLRMTPQRQLLLRALSHAQTHPTAEALYRRVRQSLPSVSHATVYRNLQELVRARLIGTLQRSGGPVQYDANPDDHHHFVCTRCRRVTDVYLKDIGYAIDRGRSGMTPARIDRAELQLHGLCVACKSKVEDRESRVQGR